MIPIFDRSGVATTEIAIYDSIEMYCT
jgi:hypothetical protein